MGLAPVVLRHRGVPFRTTAAGVVSLYFLVKALLLDGDLVTFSLVMAALSAVFALWAFLRARGASVMIDDEQIIVSRGGSSQRFDRTAVESVDLSDTGRQVRFTDGSAIGLPLEGRTLIEAGLLLSPGRSPRF